MLSALAVVLCTGLVGGVTYALFSAQSVNSSNNFTAGTVTIGNTDKTAWSTNFDNMAPGDTVSKTVTVHNTGSLDFEFVSVPSKSGALFAGTGKASVAVNNGTGTLPPGGAQDVTAAVSLPPARITATRPPRGILRLPSMPGRRATSRAKLLP